MKTSWDDALQTEQYLLGTANADSRAAFEVRLILEPSLKENMHWQKATYSILQQYGRQKRRAEIEQVAQYIFTSNKYTAFKEKVFRLFR